jgi:DNA polymerase I-like protein with 3'-5' exonuclease and polymerase domains
LTVQRCRTAFPGQIRLENVPKKRELHKSYNIAVKTLKKNAGKNSLVSFSTHLLVPEGVADDAARILKETMIQAGKVYLSKVPLEVEVTVAENWAEK